MTDKEIIKALECLKGEHIPCADCGYRFIRYPECHKCVAKDVDEYIKNQQAEIERLQTEKDKLIRTYKECALDVVKEFAERLKGVSTATWWFDEIEPTKVHVDHYVMVSDIDNLVKEMTGERE